MHKWLSQSQRRWLLSCTWLVVPHLKNLLYINPQRACVARVTVLGLLVCVCVCVCLKLRRERQVNKQNMQISAGLPRLGPLALCFLKAQRRAWIDFRELLAWRPWVTHTKSQALSLVVPHMRSSPRLCTSVVFIILMTHTIALPPYSVW